jgi:hypothetical protein
MSAKLESVEAKGDVAVLMKDMGRRARAAARTLALASP